MARRTQVRFGFSSSKVVGLGKLVRVSLGCRMRRRAQVRVGFSLGVSVGEQQYCVTTNQNLAPDVGFAS